ncbi:aldose 1-epimerase [Kaistia sp. 32K]|uniref:aldose 1-epimerase family protein n=1 Tax=Kaistia sp. 32K TaxID=2795690 RepID=UPI001915E8C4|nr:aldose 1-epimerase family protein [Kaistia sp. 32K]BCP55303.1 aldose 1-epimerase [Kaistia sp. 32K]
MAPVVIATDGFRAEIGRRGAELLSLVDPTGREWMWHGDPAFWDRRAPVLFPVVGRAANDQIRHQGRTFPMPQHGFAPEAEFELVEATGHSCRLRLEANAATRAIYPFEFRFDVAFEFSDGALRQSASVTNVGGHALAASLGFHPAFVWSPGPERTAYELRFEKPERAPIRRIVDGRLAPPAGGPPAPDGVLSLADDLVEAGAMVFDQPASRAVWFGRPGGPGIAVDFEGLPHLGIWTLPGAGFLCIEPWQGHHAPVGFDGEFFDMPGVLHLGPGESATRGIAIRCGVDAPGWA